MICWNLKLKKTERALQEQYMDIGLRETAWLYLANNWKGCGVTQQVEYCYFRLHKVATEHTHTRRSSCLVSSNIPISPNILFSAMINHSIIFTFPWFWWCEFPSFKNIPLGIPFLRSHRRCQQRCLKALPPMTCCYLAVLCHGDQNRNCWRKFDETNHLQNLPSIHGSAWSAIDPFLCMILHLTYWHRVSDMEFEYLKLSL